MAQSTAQKSGDADRVAQMITRAAGRFGNMLLLGGNKFSDAIKDLASCWG